MDKISTYKQLVSMGPRRAGRSVGNLLAAANAATAYGRATVVVAHEAMVDQALRDVDTYLNPWEAAHIKVTSLYSVRDYSGPFMIDHYAVDRIVSELASEIDALKVERGTLRLRLQEYEGKFS